MGIHFISGLPRSGSTLLAGILRQNPALTAGVSTPVCTLVRRLIADMSTGEFVSLFDEARRDALIRSLVSGYYHDAREHIIDTNRFWTTHLALLAHLYPQARVICCVRNLGWIINSVERQLLTQPTRATGLFGFRCNTSVYERTTAMMDEKKGLIMRAYAALKEAWFGPFADRLILLHYDALCDDPARVIGRLYEACGWSPFAHDFARVQYEEGAFDEAIGAPNLHRIDGPVRRATRDLIVPADIFDRYADSAFWLNDAMNVRGVEVIAPMEYQLRAVG